MRVYLVERENSIRPLAEHGGNLAEDVLVKLSGEWLSLASGFDFGEGQPLAEKKQESLWKWSADEPEVESR